MLKRIVLTMKDEEFEALEAMSNKFGFTVSQMAKHLLMGELGLPRTNLTPTQTLEKELENYVRNKRPGEDKIYVFSAFGDRWFSFDTGTKRTLQWKLKELEGKGLCRKTGKQLSNGTHEYCRI